MFDLHIRLTAIFLVFVVGACAKPYRLNILSILTFTGNEPRDAMQCLAAQKLVIGIVNNRTDILPDYDLELDTQNEGPAGSMATRVSIEYIRRMEQRMQVEKDLYQSPVNMGPLLASGCKSWAMTVGFVNMVAITGSCTAPSLTARRDLYPNMYRVRCSAELPLYGRAHYLKKVTKWRRIAIVMSLSGNPFNFETAILFYKIAVSNGFDVAAFEASPDFNDETMAALKRADIRIFTLEAAESSGALKFLCQAYRAGITGSKYFLIFQFANYVDPYNMAEIIYPGCTRSIIMEQYKISFFIGTGYEALGRDPNSRTTLGHTLADFEALYDKFVNGLRTPDYDYRHTCYDRALQTVLTLDNAEKALKKENLTLRDYPNFPEKVAKITNKSASEIDFNNLRHGRFHFSKRMEFDYEAQQVTMWSPGKGLQLLARVTCRENASAQNISSYDTQELMPINISFPRDAGIQAVTIVEVSEPLFGVVTALSCTLGILQIAIGIGLFSLGEKWASFVTKLFILLACLLLDVGAISFATTKNLTNASACNLLAVATTLGIALLHGNLNFFLYAVYKKLPRKSFRGISAAPTAFQTGATSTNYGKKLAVPTTSRLYRTSVTSTKEGSRPPISVSRSLEVSNSVTEMPQVNILPVSLSFLLVNAGVIVSWLLVDPLKAGPVILTAFPEYNEQADTYVSKMSLVCQGANIVNWILALFCFNVLPCLIGLYATMKLRYNRIVSGLPEVKLCQIAVTCTTTFYLAIFAAMFILSSVILRQAIGAFAMLVYSGSACFIIFFNLIKERLTPTTVAPVMND